MVRPLTLRHRIPHEAFLNSLWIGHHDERGLTVDSRSAVQTPVIRSWTARARYDGCVLLWKD